MNGGSPTGQTYSFSSGGIQDKDGNFGTPMQGVITVLAAAND